MYLLVGLTFSSFIGWLVYPLVGVLVGVSVSWCIRWLVYRIGVSVRGCIRWLVESFVDVSAGWCIC